MSELVAAVIGVGGTLSGVVVAGAFTLVQARRNSTDRELDRLEQRRSAAREARREVYAQMVSIMRRASAAHEFIWMSSPADLRKETNDTFARAHALEDEIEHAVNLVMLAGPHDLGERADELFYSYRDILHIAERMVRAQPNATDSLFNLATAHEDGFDAMFTQLRLDFIVWAREVLEGNTESRSPSEPAQPQT